jgi:hypothetical protein
MVKNIIISNVTTSGATIAGKVPYSISSDSNDPKVYTFTFDQTNMKTYINGELIGTVANAGNMKYLGDIFLGADYDDTEHFQGILPTIAFYDKALPDTQRILLENWLADRWLPTGTVLNGGYVTQATAGTKPSWSTTLGKAFMDFDSEGLNISGGTRVTSWTDSTTVGTQRVASPKSGTTIGITTVKGKNALNFDTKTYLKIPILDTTANSPNPVTIFFVARFNDFDTSFFGGDSAQTLLGASSNSAIRFKKFDSDNFIDMRFTTNASGNKSIQIPKNKIIVGGTVTATNSVALRLSSTSGFTSYVDSETQTANGSTNFGVTKHTFSGLTSGTKYYGNFIVDGVVETGNTLSFSTFKPNNSYKIIAGSCNQTGSNHPIWNQILSENADLFVHMGDLNYENVASSNAQVYAATQDVTFSSSAMTNFFKNQAVSYIYDNHDSLGANPNNTFDWSTFIPFFDKAYPTYPKGSASPLTDGDYWSFTIGRTRCIITGMRSKRDPIQNTDNASKTILGSVQKAWLKAQLLEAKNAGQSVMWFGGICYIADVDNPLGGSYQSGGMSWANSSFERREIANYIIDNQITNVTYVHGDSHMIGIDDGRNAIYSTISGTTRRTYKSFEDKYLIRNLAASPFDKDQDKEGGPFQINDIESSGGPLPMPIDVNGYSQSYGKIEVIDIGENWQQVKLSNVVYSGSSWIEYQSYTFNSPMTGTIGVPPLIINSGTNQNGYIGVDNTAWKKISKRYIGYNDTWKEEKFKFIGDNGYWKLIYTGDEIKKSGTFYVTALEGYTLERENSVAIYGSNLLDASIISPKTGGYFELTKNTSDLFQNFSSGNYIGTPAAASIVGGNLSLLITGTTQGFQLPITGGGRLGASDIFGTDGLKKYTLSLNVYVPSLPSAGNFIPLHSFGNRTSGYETVIDTNGAVIIKSWVANSVTTLSTPFSAVTTGWNVITMYNTGVDVSIFNTSSNTTPLIKGTIALPTSISTGATFNIGTTFNASNVYYSVNGVAYRYFYTTNSPISSNNISKLNYRKNPEIVLVDNTGTQSVIAANWINSVSNTKIMFTVPPTQAVGNYDLYLRYVGGTSGGTYSYNENESFKFPIVIRDTDLMTTPFVDNFSDPLTLRNNYYILNKAWGGANGGVVSENVVMRNGELILKANGDRYTGTIQGVDRDGKKKIHTDIGDPQLNQPWTNRVGACVIYNKKTGFGSYEIETMIPNKLGVAYAIWTFFYNEIYPNDPRYTSFLNEGLHQQGSVADGYYITRNHEIDIEFPSHLEGGTLSNPSLSNMKCNTWRGELKNWDVSPTDPTYYEEYDDNLTPVGFNIADGNYHKLRFDWYPDRVEYYIDGILKQTNTNTSKGNTIPDIAGFFTFGLWFPSSKQISKPWLVEPTKCWAGGVIDADGGMKADFDTVEMKVRKFTFTPFVSYTSELRLKGETYPFGGYNKKQ